MRRRHSLFAILVALPGMAICVFALIGFFRRIVANRLPFHPQLAASEYYLAVGRAYSTGFGVGFFLCFFLMLVALAVGAMSERRRRPRYVRADDPPAEAIGFPPPGMFEEAANPTAGDR